MSLFNVLLSALTSLVLSAWLTRSFCDPTSRFHILDHPNERSLHTNPTPRSGGVAILAAVMAGILLFLLLEETEQILAWLGISAALLAVISFVDDRNGLSVSVRLLGHLTCAGILVAGGLALPHAPLPGFAWEWPAWFGVLFSIMFLLWMINLYNFMDGMDGLAGGMAVIGFGTFGLLGYLSGSQTFAATGIIVAAAAGGFLILNFPPARIFMGDTGSSVLGLLAGAMIIWAASNDIFPFWAGLLVFSPFLVDATTTLIRRLMLGERVWQAHKTHYYQRLVQSGWGHRKTVLAEYVLMCACSITTTVALSLTTVGQIVILSLWCVVYAGLILTIEWNVKTKKPS